MWGIVKQSEGSIWAYSEKGHGTTFKPYFPRMDQPAEVLSPAPAPVDALRGTETVLLVEDEGSVRFLIRQILELKGYRVLEAMTGIDALLITAKEKEQRIDVLLTDVVMPDFSGREIAERIVKRSPETKVLYMSGYTDDVVIRHGVLEASAAFIQKPFTPAALLCKIREVLAGRSNPPLT